MKLWQTHLAGAPVVFYTDNNSARDVAISGSGRAEVPKALLEQLLVREQQSQVVAWYQRVPSPSNIHCRFTIETEMCKFDVPEPYGSLRQCVG